MWIHSTLSSKNLITAVEKTYVIFVTWAFFCHSFSTNSISFACKIQVDHSLQRFFLLEKRNHVGNDSIYAYVLPPRPKLKTSNCHGKHIFKNSFKCFDQKCHCKGKKNIFLENKYFHCRYSHWKCLVQMSDIYSFWLIYKPA